MIYIHIYTYNIIFIWENVILTENDAKLKKSKKINC